MGIILTATEDEVYEAGLYSLRLQGIESKDSKLTQEDGTIKNSAYLRWTFDILDEGFEGKVFRANSSTNFGPSAKGRKWAEALLGRTLHPNEPIDTDDLVGLAAAATIIQKKKGDNTVNEIEALAAVRRRSPQTPVQALERPVKTDEKRQREAVPRQQIAGFPDDLGDEVPEY